jgi:uncharacterized protein YqeY
MNLKEKIKEDLKDAMRAHNETAKNTLKGLLSAFTNELVANGKTPRDELSEDEILKVLKRMEKQRKDAISKFNEGGREDLVESEMAELKVLEKYLPKKMEMEKILEIAKNKKEELNFTDKSKTGILVGAVMKECAGKADGLDVKNAVESLFE